MGVLGFGGVGAVGSSSLSPSLSQAVVPSPQASTRAAAAIRIFGEIDISQEKAATAWSGAASNDD
jgi:hypothetical protein